MGKSIGKHMKKSNYIKNNKKVILIIFLLATVSITTAYIIVKNSVTNEFVLGKIKPEIIEDFNASKKLKQDVKVKNSGNVPIYIRAYVVVTWKDKNSAILETKPIEDIDYSINFSTSENWLHSSEGYYYYKIPVNPKEVTDILIDECAQIKEYEDKTLEVSIAVQAIQAEPTKAVKEAWDIETIDTTLIIER